jgi:hypothetical protein
VGADNVLELLVFASEKGFWKMAPAVPLSGMTDVGEYSITIDSTIIGETQHYVHREWGDDSEDNQTLKEIWEAILRLVGGKERVPA